MHTIAIAIIVAVFAVIAMIAVLNTGGRLWAWNLYTAVAIVSGYAFAGCYGYTSMMVYSSVYAIAMAFGMHFLEESGILQQIR